jgi:hypothetical protein
MSKLGYTNSPKKGNKTAGRPQYMTEPKQTVRVQLPDANPARGGKSTNRAKPQVSTRRRAK